MITLLVSQEFFFERVGRNSRRVKILNGAVGTAERYWCSFFGKNSAEATILNRVVANNAFLRRGVAEPPCSRFLVIG
jgi:hypothetical protein